MTHESEEAKIRHFVYSPDAALAVLATFPEDARDRFDIFLVERAVNDWLSRPSPSELRDLHRLSARYVEQSSGLLALLQEDENDFHGRDGDTLSGMLEAVIEFYGRTIPAEWPLPKGRAASDAGKASLLAYLCIAWQTYFRLAVRSSVSSVNAAAGGPLVQFFVEAASPVLGIRVSDDSARGAIRKFARSHGSLPPSADEDLFDDDMAE